MSAANSILRRIVDDLDRSLSRSGIMYRIFYRAKSSNSIEKKISSKSDIYKADGKKMQDMLALRITLYFADDVKIVYHYLKNSASFHSESIDLPQIDKFCPVRLNLVMNVPDDYKRDMRSVINDTKFPDLIDETYEIQIRTILSEGWHEVEHDLRYKCKEEWNDFMEESRLLNGIYASLESNEWSMLTLFEKLSYAHYKKCNWNSMIRNKFRLRLVDDSLSSDVKKCLDVNPSLAKKIFRGNRSSMLQCILKECFVSPLTYDTIVHLLNHIEIKDVSLAALEDPILKDELDSLFGQVV